MFRRTALLLVLVALPGLAAAQERLELRYDEPGQHFEQTLPLGNGLAGAAVYGGGRVERIHLNDMTLWTGRPVNARMNPDAHLHLPAVRAALASGDWPAADSLVRALQGSFSQSYAPLGDLGIEMLHADDVTGYERVLDLATATATVQYQVGETGFARRYFVSHPDRVLVIELEASRERALAFRVSFASRLRFAVSTAGPTLTASGEAPVHAEPSYRGTMNDAIVYDPGKGTRFAALVRVASTDGTVTGTGGTLEVVGATRATLLVSIATSFNGFDREPGLDGRDEIALATSYLDDAAVLEAEALHRRHVADFSGYFDRVALDLGPDPVPGLPTDDRLRRYSQGEDDPYLERLYFQYGRYLLISSSRTPGVPANLQGIWNPHVRPPWSANYTTNINLEMNYWPAEVTALPEMHEPLLSFIEHLSVTGQVTAETFWGTGGWSQAHNSDIWAMTNPVGDFGSGSPVWANWVMGGAWLSTHLWEHYAFTQDRAFLADRAYPLMKGAAEFVLDWLYPGPDGTLITGPSTSPENTYRTPGGYVGATTIATTADMGIARELFTDLLAAAELLGRDPDLQARLRQTLRDLTPYRIGSDGSLQEWYHDWEDSDPRHRHQSHLFGLYPGSQIDPDLAPDLAEASRVALNIKGDRSTGWAQAWRINLWARLRDGDRAHKLLRELLTYVDPDGQETYGEGGGTYPNLWDAHPPFQIDGNFGGTAGVAEMLVQSHGGVIRLLPALPSAWPTGSVRGLKARGGYTVDLAWKDKLLDHVTIRASVPGTLTLVYRDRAIRTEVAAGQVLELGEGLQAR